jgi:hypothetical protein
MLELEAPSSKHMVFSLHLYNTHIERVFLNCVHCSCISDSNIKHSLDSGVMYGPLRGLQVPPVQFSTSVNLRASTGYFQDVLTDCTCESVYL